LISLSGYGYDVQNSTTLSQQSAYLSDGRVTGSQSVKVNLFDEFSMQGSGDTPVKPEGHLEDVVFFPALWVICI
jgi:hypothetical protein